VRTLRIHQFPPESVPDLWIATVYEGKTIVDTFEGSSETEARDLATDAYPELRAVSS